VRSTRNAIYELIVLCAVLWCALQGKLVGIWLPIMTFVVCGFEHSVANMFFMPLGMLNGANVTVGDFIARNLIPVTVVTNTLTHLASQHPLGLVLRVFLALSRAVVMVVRCRAIYLARLC
jgi:hypothetical protein